MKHPIAESICTHLEFLGYMIDDVSSPDEVYDIFHATGHDKLNLTACVFDTDVTLLRTRWTGFTSAALKKRAFFTNLNDANGEAVISKWHHASDDEGVIIVVDTCYYGYEKRTFADMLELFENEARVQIQRFQPFAG